MRDIEKYAKRIWDYMRVDNELRKADVIVMFGSYDPSAAKYAAQLYLDGWAPVIVFSGAKGDGNEHWDEKEADRYAGIAREMGVPDKDILIEDKSTNTAENIKFTKKLLTDKGLIPKLIIVIHKPFMGRRVLATMEKEWNDIEFIITSKPVSFEEYKVPELTRDELIGSITGDLERLKLYAQKGFQTKHDIPDDVWEARNKIREAGLMRRYIDIK